MPADSSALPWKYAGLGRRFAALCVDLLVLSAVFFPVTRIVKGSWVMSAGDHAWSYGWIITDPLCLIFLAIIVAYFVVGEGLFGATVGKQVLGLRVVGGGDLPVLQMADVKSRRPGLQRAFVRNLCRAVDALPVLNLLGVYLIATSSNRTRFGDRVAETRVVVRR